MNIALLKIDCGEGVIAPTDSESSGRGLLYKAGRQASRHSVTVPLNVRIAKTRDLSDCEHGMIAGARHTGFSISEMATRLGFSRTSVERVS